MELLDAFSIFDPRTLPPDHKELAGHGQERLEILVATFGGDSIGGEECTSEWECLKRLIHNNCSSLTQWQMLRLLYMDQSLQDKFPQLTKLSTIAALIHVGRVECECSFSAMNRMKTELRNRLKTSTLDCLMRISIEGLQLSEFNYERAADIWGAMRNR